MTKEEGRVPSTAGLRKWLTGGVVAAVAVAGAVVGFAGPAAADPTTTYVGVGSDTIQDVMNGISVRVGLGVVGSWDAVDPATGVAGGLINPKPGCVMTRPNGSGAGVSALRASINPATGSPPPGTPPSQGCVDFARSSSGPTVDANGLLVYIPFALDAVTSATGPATSFGSPDPATATELVDADQFTKANLVTLYSCNTITVNNKVYDPRTGAVDNPGATPPVIAVHVRLPQLNSGTRNFWAGQMGINATTPPSCVLDTYTDGTGSHAVEEHNGAVFAADPNALGPFSVAQFISQTNGHNPRLHHVAIHSLGTDNPTTENPTTGNPPTLNKQFQITRQVYNVAYRYRVILTTGHESEFDAGLASLFVGAGSRTCTNGITITSFGFATLAGAPLGHNCGDSDSSLWGVPVI